MNPFSYPLNEESLKCIADMALLTPKQEKDYILNVVENGSETAKMALISMQHLTNTPDEALDLLLSFATNMRLTIEHFKLVNPNSDMIKTHTTQEYIKTVIKGLAALLYLMPLNEVLEVAEEMTPLLHKGFIALQMAHELKQTIQNNN